MVLIAKPAANGTDMKTLSRSFDGIAAKLSRMFP